MDGNIKKWKNVNDPQKEEARREEIRAKYEQNEEKRKQMAAEAQRKRKEKENRLKIEEEKRKKAEEEVLVQRKKDKQQAYIRFLRGNSEEKPRCQAMGNLHDKYEAKKKEKLEQVDEMKGVSKWKSKNKNLQGLDLDIQTQNLEQIKKFYEKGNQQLKVIEDFEKEWQDEHLSQSSMIDSLDLDAQTLKRSKLMQKQQQPLFQKEFKDMKNSLVFVEEQIEREDNDKDIKDLIGYESGSNFWNVEPRKPEPKKTEPKKQESEKDAFKKKSLPKVFKPIDQKQIDEMTEDLQKVQPLGWAESKIQQAEELFSNCSSNSSRRSFPRSHILKQVNDKLKKDKNVLNSIPQQPTEDINTPVNREQRKTSKSTSKQKSFKTVIRKTPQKINKSSSQTSNYAPNQPKQPPIKQKYTQERPVLPKPKKQEKKQSKTVQKFRTKVQVPKPTTTVCTLDDMIHIDQFIKDELRDLNNRERQLQVEIKKMHTENKDKLKEVEKKYEINSTYTTTKNIAPAANTKKPLTESQMLEQSLYRIEQMLIRKQQTLKQLSQKQEVVKDFVKQVVKKPTAKAPEKEAETPQFPQKKPQEVIARLTALISADNETDKTSSREKVSQNGPSYGQLRKNKKQQIAKWRRENSQERNKTHESELKSIAPVLSQPPVLPLRSNDPQDSLDQRDEKIRVNDQLRRLLLE